MDETIEGLNDGDRKVHQIDEVNVVTTNVTDHEGMVIYKGFIDDCYGQYTGYGATRAEAAIVALNRFAG